MIKTPTVEDLQQQLAALEAELARLRPIEAAAREAYAFYAGRRRGFAPSYPRDVLTAVFEQDKRKESSRRTRRKPRL